MSDLEWVKHVPHSQMAYPDSLWQRIKRIYWVAYTPIHPYVRDIATAIGIVRHAGRQNFLLGTIMPDLSIEEFVNRMVERGYANHFVAWRDAGEIVSLRLAESFVYQYHLRVFEDREVRGHYEYTPECHPVAHMLESGFEARRDDFLRMIGDCIVPCE